MQREGLQRRLRSLRDDQVVHCGIVHQEVDLRQLQLSCVTHVFMLERLAWCRRFAVQSASVGESSPREQ